MAQRKKKTTATHLAKSKKEKAASRVEPSKKKNTAVRTNQPKNKNLLLALGAAGLAALGFGAYKVISGRQETPDEENTGGITPAEGASSGEKAKSRRKFSGKSALLLFLGTCCLAVFCFSAYKIVSELWQSHKEAQAFEDLTDLFGPDYTPVYPDPTQPGTTTSPATGPSGSGSGPTAPPQILDPTQPNDPGQPTEPVIYRFSKYDALYEQNHDLFGWIAIDGTVINYPVMFTPKDPEYYLRRGFDKKKANAGTPFLDGDCFVGCGNYLIYGHRMNNGSMFRILLEYEKKSFWQEHPIIHFDTLDEPGTYEIIAAFYSRIYAVNEENVFRYYNYTDLTNEKTFNAFMTQVYAAARYSTGVTAEFGDQLLTLSTCSYHVDNGRFVVVAKRIS